MEEKTRKPGFRGVREGRNFRKGSVAFGRRVYYDKLYVA